MAILLCTGDVEEQVFLPIPAKKKRLVDIAESEPAFMEDDTPGTGPA